MFRYRFLRIAAIALIVYGLLGLPIAAAMFVVGATTFGEIARLQTALDAERGTLVQALRTVSTTMRNTAGATTEFQRSIESARRAADDASLLANNTAGTFRELAQGMNIQIFGLQPMASIAPQFDRGADQLTQLAISLGITREALSQNARDVQRVGGDLDQLQRQVDAVATSLSQPGMLSLGSQALLPFQIAFYGMCLLVILQSAFSIVAGIALYRLQRAMGTEPLFPFLVQPALPPPPEARTATTSAADAHGRAPTSTPAQ
jgi:hypothetical protein